MKKAYKELRKKLKDDFTKVNSGFNYEIQASVGYWVKQSGIKPTAEHTTIICLIFDAVPYPYQPQDRKEVLDFLKKNKYKDYAKLFNIK